MYQVTLSLNIRCKYMNTVHPTTIEQECHNCTTRATSPTESDNEFSARTAANFTHKYSRVRYDAVFSSTTVVHFCLLPLDN